MECDELIRLRSQAQQLRKELDDRRARARDRKVNARPDRANAADYEGFLQRRIQRASDAIQAHVSQHNCQE
ncbi:MAG TPA: hypothetical protein VL382_09445 [Terriglobales bacterium]|nr:hypothetical protein [Terriglobales bacterium]